MRIHKAAALLAGMAFAANALCEEPAAMDGSAIRKLIAEAKDKGSSYVKIPAGSYKISPEPDAKSHLPLKDLFGMTIDGTGVELLCQDMKRASAITLLNCADVTLKGFAIDADPICFTQGKIAAIDPDFKFYDVRIDKGYQDDPALFPGKPRPMSVFDPKTLRWKEGVDDLYIAKIEVLEKGLWRVWTSRNGHYNVAIGDPAAIPFGGGCAVSARESKNLVYDSLTLYQSGSMAFHEHGGYGNTRVVNCKVARRPGTDRLLSTNADGFHCKSMRVGPKIENSTFQYMHDDGTNIHGMYGAVVEDFDGTSALLMSRFEQNIQEGDSIEFYDGLKSERTATVKVVSLEKSKAGGPKLAKALFGGEGPGLTVKAILDKPVKAKSGDYFMNLNVCGAGFSVKGCSYGPLRYRAMLIQSRDGLIDGNKIDGVAYNGIEIEGACRWEGGNFQEGPFCQNILIKGNSFANIGALPNKGVAIDLDAQVWAKKAGGAISWHDDGSADTRKSSQSFFNNAIRIEGNTINGTAEDGIRVKYSTDIAITGNKLSGIGALRGKSAKPIDVKYSGVVEQEGN